MVDLYFDDIIKVDRVDADGKKFDKVSRIEAQSEEDDMQVLLDVNTEIYPVHAGQKFRMALAPTLNLDGTTVTSYFPEGGHKSLADKFEYVMHGLLYKISEDTSGPNAKVMVYVSYGGLQMMLKGDPSKMGKFKVDQRLFLLLRKV
uniref:Putative DNA-directed RNA polymerases II, IV and V subunit 8B-like n=1 Tax=Davidia involucrata TaxID=16924 RepID=A0A5B6Z037_DAVIN